MKKLSVGFLVLGIGSAICLAGPAPKLGKDKTVVPVEELFRANEFDVSLFGAVGLGRVDHYNTTQAPGLLRQIQGPQTQEQQLLTTTTTRHYVNTAWGGGLEADYFFTRYFGIGIEGDFLDGHDAISSASGSLIGRYPIEYGTWGWAPYGFIGGGGQFDSQNAGFGQVGAGAEVRFKCHWGIFTDARWVLHDVFIDYALIRAGIRFNF